MKLRQLCHVSLYDSSFLPSQISLCLRCQSSYLQVPLRPRMRYYATAPESTNKAKKTTDAPLTTTAPRKSIVSDTKTGEKTSTTKESGHAPKPLERPIGLLFPPRPGDNTGIDPRSLQQRREDFVDYEKHIERRRDLTRQWARPYFRDWKLLRHHEGKTFLAPPRLFRSESCLYFPNLYGRTLAAPRKPTDTTPVLLSRVSVVALYSSLWGERQVGSFISREANPSLHEYLTLGGNDDAQIVRINVETNWFKALLIRLFMGGQRRKLARQEWGRYFLVRKGLSDEIRGATAAVNGNVGYIYLVDWEGKIRWASSGAASPGEIDGLNRGVEKLVAQWRASREPKST